MARRPPKPIPPEERAQILRMATEGAPYRDIATLLDRPQGTINRVISDGILDGTVPRRFSRFENRKA